MDGPASMFSVQPPALTPSSEVGHDMREILGVNVRVLERSEALAEIEGIVRRRDHAKYAFLNAHAANLAWEDDAFRETLSRFQVLADGVGVDLASSTLYGKSFPANLNGTDFIPALLGFIDRPLAVALLGAKAGVAEEAAAKLSRRFEEHTFTVVGDGYFPEAESARVLDIIARLDPDILLVAFGNPWQEFWIDRHCRSEHAHVVIGVGALFDFLAERVPRAPRVWRALRIEWIYRLLLEPRRLWRRYILGNPKFMMRVLKQKVTGRGKIGEHE